jgi:DNA polymerase III subunit gamma/tau
MIEATNIRTIDDIINQIEKIEPKKETIVSKPIETVIEKSVEKPVEKIVEKLVEVAIEKPIEKIVENLIVEQKIETKIEVPVLIKEESNPFMEEETKIEELSPFDEVLIQSNNTLDLNVIDAIEVVDYSNPFDEMPIPKELPKVEEKKKQIVQEIEIEEIALEKQAYVNIHEEIQIVPLEDADEDDESKEHDENDELYEQLTSKVYDRDYTLGECFEKNFIFNGFENKKLYIISRAQDEERKLLYKYFGIIKTFAQDVFGNDVELDFQKEEPSEAKDELVKNAQNISNNPVLKEEEEPSLKEESKQEDDSHLDDTSSMLESIEMSAGCVADMTKSSVVTPSQQELQLNDILNSKMLDKAKELFDIRKITVKSRS